MILLVNILNRFNKMLFKMQKLIYQFFIKFSILLLK